MAKRYWLFKSEPSAYSFSNLMDEPDQTAEWDGVRNYQARNFLRDEVKEGDGVLFYHSNASPPSVVGTAVVVREGYPDFTAWDPSSEHPDPKSTPDNPRWFMVDIKGLEALPNEVTLAQIRAADRRRSRRRASTGCGRRPRPRARRASPPRSSARVPR